MRKIIGKHKNSRLIFVLIGVLLTLVILFSFYYYQIKNGRVFIDDSLISAPIGIISPTNTSVLNSLNVYEGENVKKGDILAVVGTNLISAATDGLIVSANDQLGESVSPQTQLIEMIDPTSMRVAGTIDENKGLNDIKVGQVASFTVDAIPGKTFWGYVDEISPSAKQTALSFSISTERPTQQFVIYVKYDAKKYSEIKNGMSAKISVYTKTN